MSYALEVIRLAVTTDSSSADTVSSEQPVVGFVEKCEWQDGTLADGVGATLSVVGTEDGVDRTLLTLTDANNDAVYFPRELEDDNTGSALTTHTRQAISGYLKLVISSGGAAKTGGMTVFILK